MNAMTFTPASNPRVRSLARTALVLLVCLLMSACSVLGKSTRERATVYDVDPRVAADAAWPAVTWQLALAPVSASRVGDSLRIAVRPTENELQIYKGARWARVPTDMLEGAILRAMEDSGRITAVARQGSGISAEYRLLLELRRFEAAYRSPDMPPTVQIEINAKLLHTATQRVAASHTFLEEAPATSTAVENVVDAFNRALHDVTADVVGWVLVNGNTDTRVRAD